MINLINLKEIIMLNMRYVRRFIYGSLIEWND